MKEINSYFEKLYRDSASEPIKDRAELKKYLASALGTFERGDAENSPELIETAEFPDFRRERFVFSFSEDLAAPVYVLTPKNGSSFHPSVLALHGHGYGSREIVGLTKAGCEDEEKNGIHQHFAVKLVKRGFKVFAPEIIGFGDRRLEVDVQQGKSSSCYRMAVSLLMAGKTLAGLRVFEAQRTVDHMTFFKDTSSDPGIMGFSGGGLIAALTAALDERIKAAVLSGFSNTFHDSILAMEHCIDNYVPGLINGAELPDYIGLLAPRPLFIEAGINDPIFPLRGTKTAISRLEEIYEEYDSKNNLASDVFEGQHQVSGRRSYSWLQNQLGH
ncbi:dienelactone hydrolase family protein [Alteribacillus sp. HJP-4]|uniref:dienelactone hydrolase family protein n=1 Tax=Alteribacillus sp. HJP-4 TaxID=2775394 RepID=UPI0035CD2667